MNLGTNATEPAVRLQDARDSAHFLDSFDAWIPSMLELGRPRAGRDRSPR